MLGNYDEGTTTVRQRDIGEYATMKLLIEVMADLKRQGKTVTPSMMQQFRDNWKRDGQPVNFEIMGARVSDFERLLRSTGATSFGRLDKYPTLGEGIGALWVEAKEEYDKEAKKGNYLHVVTDPIIREHILKDNKQPVRAIFVHKGKSARMLNPGDNVTFYSPTDKNYKLTGKVSEGQQQVQSQNQSDSNQGFGQAPIYGQGAAETTATTDTKTTNTPNTNTTQTQDPSEEIEIADEQFLGWFGGTIDDREYRGLSHVMGAYLTKADAELVAKNMDADAFFDAKYANNAVELLRHMRSNGYDFNVRENSERNQIEVRVGTAENVNVRVFDPADNGTYIGRIYDSYNVYYMNKMGSRSTEITPEDSIAILDYVTGHKLGKVKKSVGTDSSAVNIEGVDMRTKVTQVKPAADRYRAIIFNGKEEAEEHIKTAIASATAVVQDEFRIEELQALIDSGLEDENVLVTGPEFQAQLEALYSNDVVIREAQERAAMMMIHSEDGGLAHLEQARHSIVGDYENGFNPAFVIDHMEQTGRGNERDAMMAALKTAGYDLNKIQGNDFAVNALRERLVTFDPSTAKSIDEVEHPMIKHALSTVADTLKYGGFVGKEGYGSEPEIKIDENGIIQWTANRRTRSNAKDKMWQTISGEIGQIMVPNEHGIIETKFQGENNYGIVPGYTGYFAFEGDYDDRMKRFRVKGFEQHLTEQLRAQVTHQMTRPLVTELNNIPSTLDASSLNGLYHGDVYGKRIELDFMETNQLDDVTKAAILKTLSNRVRFDNQFSDYATTSAETQANRDLGAGDDTAAFSYWKVAGETNMRVLDKDLENYADLTMTGTGKTQGLIWYLTDGAEVNSDGSVTPSKGILQADGSYVPDKTALQKLPYFDKKDFNAWDRNQMSANQLMTALKVDEKVNATLMSFGGWTFDDSYAVSKEFAERNKVFGNKPNEDSMRVLDDTLRYLAEYENLTKDEVLAKSGMMWSDDVLNTGLELRAACMVEDRSERATARIAYNDYLEEHGRFRPLQRGDKLSDFGGNKGTIGIVIDRYMSPEKAKAQGLDKEVRFMKANPDLDVISAPYSMLSRHNAGVVQELMSGEVRDLIDPDTGEVFESAMGQLNIIITDMKVDDKTHAYTREDVLDGKGRKASGQLAWALQSKGAEGILNEIYGRNDSAWSTYREYLIATGLDMKADGTIVHGYTPHADEVRNHFAYDPEVDASAFLDKIKDQGGFLDIPFDVDFKNGQATNSIPVLSASLRQNVELIDGSMRRSDFTNQYANIYQSVGEYMAAETDEAREKARAKAQDQFDKIQSTIIDRQFDGGHNGKHSFIRDKIMGKRMQHSATGVAIVDPRLNIGEAGMNQDMMDALDAKEGDIVMAFRDPVWRDGAIRAMKVVKDDTVHGISINPIADKSHDMDFDGDTMGIMKFDTKAANRDLVEKFSHWANMIDHGNGKDELYFQTGMDLASAEAKAEKLGDNTPKELYERAVKNAKSDNPKLLKQAERDLNKYSHKLFREHGFGGDFVSLTNDETVYNSFKQMVDNGAKGSIGKLNDYMDYHTGKKTDYDAREIQYATGVKSDDTGLAGAFSQKLVSVMRNQNITAALESMYPLTQGTLQIKHDANHARTVNEILTEDMNKTFRGKDMYNSKRSLTPSSFKTQLSKIMDEKMKVDVNEKFIDAVTETLTHNGKILPLKDAMAIKGSPMDRVAYGGGYEELKRLADKGESLLEGEQNKLFAPFTMRNADETTKLAKKDTQRSLLKESAKQVEHQVSTEESYEHEDMGVAL